MNIILLFLSIAYAVNANQSTFEKAAKISCDMVKQESKNHSIHWVEKQRLRRVYFKSIYDEFERNPITRAEELYQALPHCD